MKISSKNQIAMTCEMMTMWYMPMGMCCMCMCRREKA